MKARNKRVYSTDHAYLTLLREEYTLLGFDTSLERGCLTVYSRRRKRSKAVADSKKSRNNSK